MVRRGCAGLAAAAACLLLLIVASTPGQALALTCAATFCLGFAVAGLTSVPLGLLPRHAPMLIGISNTLATIPGIAGVAIAGRLLDATHGYAAVFWVTAAVVLVGAAVLALVPMASGERLAAATG